MQAKLKKGIIKKATSHRYLQINERSMKKLKITNRFGVTPNQLLNDESISLRAKGLFAYLQSKPDDWNFSGERIQNDHIEGKHSVYKALKELEEAGYLKRNKSKNQKGTWEWEYVLFSCPYADLPQTDTPETDIPDTVKRETNKERVTKKDKEIKKKEAEEIKLPEWLNKKAWQFWIEHRKEIKRKLTKNAIKLQLKFLEQRKEDHALIIAQSIQNGWTGLFELNKKTRSDKEKAWDKMQREKREDEQRLETADSNVRYRQLLEKQRKLAQGKKL